MKISHISAKASHYNKQAESYDAFNERNSRVINQTIEKILRKYKVKNVLDLTCGTGSQVFWLAKRGFEVVGCDINVNMLKIARAKLTNEKLARIQFLKGDMRTMKVGGQFDAAITIFNAIGHLTKRDFEKAIRNIHNNLRDDGLYIFDIFNLNYLLKDDHICDLTIDWQSKSNRVIQYSTINIDGTLKSFTTTYEHQGSSKSKISKSTQTLQVYTSKQLKKMLQRNGFKVIGQCAIDGSKFIESKTDRMVVTARKI